MTTTPSFPNRRQLLAGAALGLLPAATLAQMSRPQIRLDSVIPFDTHTWQRLLDKGPRPAAYLFASMDSPDCERVFGVLRDHVMATRKMAELVIVMTDAWGGDALRQARHYLLATRMYAFMGDKDAIRQSVDAHWNGSTPYTVLLEREGPVHRVTDAPSASLLQLWLHH